jgi:hypothetical protein
MPEPDVDQPNPNRPTTTINNHNTTNPILYVIKSIDNCLIDEDLF